MRRAMLVVIAGECRPTASTDNRYLPKQINNEDNILYQSCHNRSVMDSVFCDNERKRMMWRPTI